MSRSSSSADSRGVRFALLFAAVLVAVSAFLIPRFASDPAPQHPVSASTEPSASAPAAPQPDATAARAQDATPDPDDPARTEDVVEDGVASGGAAPSQTARSGAAPSVAAARNAALNDPALSPFGEPPSSHAAFVNAYLARVNARPEQHGPIATTPSEAQEFEFIRTVDPSTQTVPTERLLRANAIGTAQAQRRLMPAVNSAWDERGPDNWGGRTRGLTWDPNPTTPNRVWAGGVSGGLWYTDDITTDGVTWTPQNDLWENLALTALAFDPSNAQTMYAGTGEGFSNSDAVRGGGIWKSTNGGASFTRLPSTDPSTDAAFQYVNDLTVTGVGTVLTATRDAGVRRSTNGGSTWTTVLSTANGTGTSRSADLEIAADGSIYASMGVFSQESVWKSVNDGQTWTQQAVPVNDNSSRIELCTAPSDANTVYGLSYRTNQVFKTTNGGTNWATVATPAIGIGTQGWYDLICAVDPNDPNRLYAGAVGFARSDNGGTSWTVTTPAGGITSVPHPDHHALSFRPGSSSELIGGNDGGVYYSGNANANPLSWIKRSDGYNVTQFYGGGIHPNAGSNVILGGTQDNAVQYFDQPGVESSLFVFGGDGGNNIIDQDNPDFAIALAFRAFAARSFDGGSQNNFDLFIDANSTPSDLFIAATGYDDRENLFFLTRQSGTITRASNLQNPAVAPTVQSVSIPGMTGPASAFAASTFSAPGTSTVFIGTTGGQVFRVQGVEPGGALAATNITGTINTGYISSIEIGASESQLLVTVSNYGVNSVYETLDGGATWANKDSGSLPDMPVRWAVYNPNDRDQVILATESGIWETTDISQGTPAWQRQPAFPTVRVDQFQFRESDDRVVAFTHGRGIFQATFGGGAFFAVTTRTPAVVNRGGIGRVTLTVNNSTAAAANGVQFTVGAEPTLTDIYFGGGADASAGTVTSQGQQRVWTVDVPAGTSETLAYDVVVGREAPFGSVSHTGTLEHPLVDGGSATVGTAFQVTPVQIVEQVEQVQTVGIPDNACPAFTESTLDVPAGFDPDEIRIGVNITHRFRFDLEVRVQSPLGTEVTLLQSAGGASANLDALFLDGGGALNTATHDAAAPFYDNVGAPQGSLAPLASEDPTGTWRLRVCDGFNTDAGQINRWAVQIVNDFVAPSVVSGGPGWRMIAAPADGVTVDDLAALNLVQGVPGFYPAAATNLFTGYDGVAFTATGAGAPLAPGQGAFWYFYDNDLDPGGPSQSFALPVALSTSNTFTTTDTDVALSATGDGSNLLGNPFGVSLDVSNVGAWPGASNLSNTVVQTYSAADGGYVTNATVQSFAPWQGFWAEAATAGTLTIPASARTTGGVFTRTSETPTVAFELSTADGTRRDRAAVVRFSDEAADGADRLDAAKRAPAAASFVTLAPEGMADGETVLRAVETRATPTTPVTVPLHAHAVGTGGDVVLTWPTLDLPDDWAAELRDLATGVTVDLRETEAYAFTLAPTAARAALSLGGLAERTGAARFELVVGPGSLVANDADGASATGLGAPFPNPSRELARVPFTLADGGAVRLSVFDALGREVAVLADGEFAAGPHAATLNTARLATGTYVIRLAAGGEVMTQRATVVR